MVAASRQSKLLAGLVFVFVLTFVAAGFGFGFFQTLLTMALIAAAAILTALITVSLTKEGY